MTFIEGDNYPTWGEDFRESFSDGLGQGPRGPSGSVEADRVNAIIYHSWMEWNARYTEWCEHKGRKLSASALHRAKQAYGDMLEKQHGKREPDPEWVKRKKQWDEAHPGGRGW